jgi:ABC-type anion transport system duplicated permease subunit
VFLREFSLWAERYKFVEEPRTVQKDTLMRFYSWVNHRSISKLFLLVQGRGVTRFTSTLARFRRGAKYALLIIVVGFVILELGAIMTAAGAVVHFPSLSTVASNETQVLYALALSFLRVWYVYFICVAVALPLGVALALNGKAYSASVPVLEVVASIPAPALLPVLVAGFKNNGEAVAAIIIFLGMFWYIIFNVIAGVRSLPSELFELKREFKISKLQAWRNIYLPASLTAFVTGSITAVGAAWNTLIIAEYFQNPHTGVIETQVSEGIGKTIAIATYSGTSGNPLVLTLAVLSMTVLIVIFNLSVWRRVYHYVTRKYTYNR